MSILSFLLYEWGRMIVSKNEFQFPRIIKFHWPFSRCTGGHIHHVSIEFDAPNRFTVYNLFSELVVKWRSTKEWLDSGLLREKRCLVTAARWLPFPPNPKYQSFISLFYYTSSPFTLHFFQFLLQTSFHPFFDLTISFFRHFHFIAFCLIK